MHSSQFLPSEVPQGRNAVSLPRGVRELRTPGVRRFLRGMSSTSHSAIENQPDVHLPPS